jgi:hypothetical protein
MNMHVYISADIRCDVDKMRDRMCVHADTYSIPCTEMCMET